MFYHGLNQRKISLEQKMEAEHFLPPLLEEREYDYSDYLRAIRALSISCENGLELVMNNLNSCYSEAVLSSLDELLSSGTTQSKYEVISQHKNFLTSALNLEKFYEYLITNARIRSPGGFGSFSIDEQSIKLYQDIIRQTQVVRDYLENLYGKSEDDIVQLLNSYKVFLVRNYPQYIPLQIVSEEHCIEITRDVLQNIKDCKNDFLILKYPQIVRSFNGYLASTTTEEAQEYRQDLLDNLELIRETLVSEVIVRDYNAYYVTAIGKVPDEGHLRYRNSLIPLIRSVDDWLVDIPETTFFPDYNIISFYDTLDKYYTKINETRHRTLSSPIPSTLEGPSPSRMQASLEFEDEEF